MKTIIGLLLSVFTFNAIAQNDSFSAKTLQGVINIKEHDSRGIYTFGERGFVLNTVPNNRESKEEKEEKYTLYDKNMIQQNVLLLKGYKGRNVKTVNTDSSIHIIRSKSQDHFVLQTIKVPSMELIEHPIMLQPESKVLSMIVHDSHVAFLSKSDENKEMQLVNWKTGESKTKVFEKKVEIWTYKFDTISNGLIVVVRNPNLPYQMLRANLFDYDFNLKCRHILPYDKQHSWGSITIHCSKDSTYTFIGWYNISRAHEIGFYICRTSTKGIDFLKYKPSHKIRNHMLAITEGDSALADKLAKQKLLSISSRLRYPNISIRSVKEVNGEFIIISDIAKIQTTGHLPSQPSYTSVISSIYSHSLTLKFNLEGRLLASRTFISLPINMQMTNSWGYSYRSSHTFKTVYQDDRFAYVSAYRNFLHFNSFNYDLLEPVSDFAILSTKGNEPYLMPVASAYWQNGSFLVLSLGYDESTKATYTNLTLVVHKYDF